MTSTQNWHIEASYDDGTFVHLVIHNMEHNERKTVSWPRHETVQLLMCKNCGNLSLGATKKEAQLQHSEHLKEHERIPIL